MKRSKVTDYAALNDFFTQQTHLDESNATIPNLVPFNGTSELDSIILNSIEVESVLQPQ